MKRKAINLDNVEKFRWNPRGSSIQRKWDSVQPGLCIRIYHSPADKRETGRRSFQVRFTENGKQRFKTLGTWPAMSVEEARTQAAEIRQNVKNGLPAKSANSQTTKAIFDEIMADEYYPIHSRSAGHKRNIKSLFKNHVTFKDVPVKDLTAEHWLSIIDRQINEKNYGAALNLQRMTGTFYKNVQQNPSYRTLANPIKGISIHIPKSNPRQPLTPAQLAEFVHDDEHPIHSAITRVLILSGQRISEVLRMRWDMLENGVWIVGQQGEMKNKTSAHHLPLTDGILEAIEPMKEFGSEWVFPGRVNHLVISAYKKILQKDNPHISPHIFRHTFASLGIDKAGIDPYSISLVLHHSIGGITHNVYMKGQQLEKKKEALKEWESYVKGLS